MEKIRSVSELPSWFFSDNRYPNNLCAKDWYIEIALRLNAFGYYGINSFEEILEASNEGDSIARYMKNSEKLFNDFVNVFEFQKSPTSYLNRRVYVNLFNPELSPIKDLSISETIFIREGARFSSNKDLLSQYERLLSDWINLINTSGDEQNKLFEQYDTDLALLLEDIDNNRIQDWNEPVKNYFSNMQNPLMEFGPEVSGSPLTVNTNFSDETIIKHFKKWLADIRKTEKQKKTRDFNLNDFGDWATYRIREVFDLSVWAKYNNVKILDRVMAEALWTNSIDGISPIDVLRTTSRKKTSTIFREKTAHQLLSQITIE